MSAGVEQEAATLLGGESVTDAHSLPTRLPDTAVVSATPTSIFSKRPAGEGLGSYFQPRPIGSWKFGSIVEASHPHLDREAILFVLDEAHAKNEGLREWFMNSARMLASVQDPHIAATILEAVNSPRATFVAIAKREFGSMSGLLEACQRRELQQDGDDLAKHFRSLLCGLEKLHNAGIVLGTIQPNSFGRIASDNSLVLLPFQNGFPGESMVTEAGKITCAQKSIRQRDNQDLADAFLRALLGEGSRQQLPKVITRKEVRKRIPLINPGLARLLTETSHQGARPDKISALNQQLDVLSRQSLRPVSWSDRIGTLLYDFALYGGVAFAGMVILGILYAGLGGMVVGVLGITFFIGWTSFVLLASEPLFNATPGRKLRGLFLVRDDGRPTSRRRLFLRSLIRLATWVALTLLMSAALRLVIGVAVASPRRAAEEYVLMFLFPALAVGIPAVYSTAWFLGGRPLHDWLTGIRMVRYVSAERTAQNDEELTRPGHNAVGEFQSDHRNGNTVDQYRLGGELGRGGMGAVHHAWDTMLGREVAVKVITLASGSDSEALPRFEREAKLVAMLDHPNIANVYGVGTWDDQPYMAMEYVAGRNFSELTDENGPLPVAAAWDLITQAARGLGHASQRGIVHRDVKPSNLMVTSTGTVKVMDFGISKGLSEEGEQRQPSSAPDEISSRVVTLLQPDDMDAKGGGQSLTRTGSVMGTPQYMSPEQAQGIQLDTRSDIYSLGLSLYSLLAGKPPFASTEFYDLLVKQCTESPPPLPKNLLTSAQQAVLDRMLAKDPTQRYQDFSAVISALTESAPQPLRLAPAATRVGAAMLDGVVLNVLMIVLELLWSFVGTANTPVVRLFLLLTAFACFLMPVRYFGWTLGKWLLKLRVRPLKGKRLNWRQTLIRCLVKWPQYLIGAALITLTPFLDVETAVTASGTLGFFIIVYYAIGITILCRRVDRRTLHDLAAETRVVKLPAFRDK
ncbi:protein kinase domain-containing protein [Planctomycetaceae bacterium SH139]